MYLHNIIANLSTLKQEVSLRNAISLYDINIIAEDFYAELLNLICGYNLSNANHLSENAPAIDLIDIEKRIAIQVTSDNSSDKIKHTIQEFIQHDLYKCCDRLIILILTQKKNYSADFGTQDKFAFDKNNDIWDISYLVKRINELDVEKIRSINDFLAKEFCAKLYEVKSSQASEVDTIIDLIEYISKHKKVKNIMETIPDPEYKIYNRFREFADGLTSQYTSLLTVYGSAMNTVIDILGIDEAQELVTRIYLQDISVKYLDEANDNPIIALNNLVDFFEERLSENGKKYDRAAIKFYLVSELINCKVFPNERSEYNGSK